MPSPAQHREQVRFVEWSESPLGPIRRQSSKCPLLGAGLPRLADAAHAAEAQDENPGPIYHRFHVGSHVCAVRRLGTHSSEAAMFPLRLAVVANATALVAAPAPVASST
jgi:hypothetical protein